MASYFQGYDEDRFVTEINRNFFCLICSNVLRDPVICPKNQHCFCRSCITKYLKTAQRCPTCADPLTVETLVDATRIVKDYLNESNIRCVNMERGCQEILQLEKLDQHEATCGFTSVVCTNEGCGVIVSRRDLVHHESKVCEFRKLKCHSCEKTTKCLIEMEQRLTNMEANIKENVENVEKNIKENVDKIEENMNQKMGKVEVMMAKNRAELQAGMTNLKANLERRFKAQVGGLKAAMVERFDEMKDVLVKLNPDIDNKKDITKEGRPLPIPTGDREHILVAGGFRKNSVEMFNWHQKAWSPLQFLPEWRDGATSFVHNNHVTVAGGYYSGFLDTMTQMNIETSPDLSRYWSEYPVKLPAKLAHHSSVVYNDQLVVTGGSHEYGATSHCIYEVQLSYPYSSKILSKMPKCRQAHCSAMFDDNLLTIGGRTSGRNEDSLDSVLLYDVKKDEYKHLAPLPYEVSSFASVKYGDNIAIIGGVDKHGNALNTVVMYNVMTQQSHMLPPMKFKRAASAAVILGKNIVVLGGRSERGGMKSVEVFSFDSFAWNELPEMLIERWFHTAVAV